MKCEGCWWLSSYDTGDALIKVCAHPDFDDIDDLPMQDDQGPFRPTIRPEWCPGFEKSRAK